MDGVTWIKLSVSFLEDEKIRFIRQLPSGDTVVLIFVGLLCLCAKKNADGEVYLTEQICYSESALADLFQVKPSLLDFALRTLQKLEMIRELDNGRIEISNWAKYQNFDVLDKIREQTAERMRKYRQKKKKVLQHQFGLPMKDLANEQCDKPTQSDVTNDVTVTSPLRNGNGAVTREIEIEKEKESTPLPVPPKGGLPAAGDFVTKADEAKKIICEKILGRTAADASRPWRHDVMVALVEQLPIPMLEIERIAWYRALPDDGSPELARRIPILSEHTLITYWSEEFTRANMLWKKWHGWEEAAVK